MTLDEILDSDAEYRAAEAVKVATWTRLTLRAVRLACDVHKVNFAEIAKREMARP